MYGYSVINITLSCAGKAHEKESKSNINICGGKLKLIGYARNLGSCQPILVNNGEDDRSKHKEPKQPRDPNFMQREEAVYQIW